MHLELPSSPESPRRARQAIREACDGWGVSEDLADVATLAVSELVTNAVVHAGTPILVVAEHDGNNLTVSVGDGESTLPELRIPKSDDEAGRGVTVIDRLGATWGVERTVLGKLVWIRFAA